MRHSRLRSAINGGVSVIRFLSLLAVLAVALAAPAHADNVQYFYDPDGRLVGVVDPVNGSAQYTYDATGNILSVTTTPTTAVSVVGFSPATGQVGTVVTIGGTDFHTTADTAVNFNGTAATPSAVTATSITVTVPAGATTGPVTVTAPGGTMTSVANYTVQAAPNGPTISSFSPTIVAPGDTITIAGSNFDIANNQVLVNGRVIQITAATVSSITATIPAIASGAVTVVTPSGKATATGDLFIAPALFGEGGVSSGQRVTLPAAGTGLAVSANVASTSQATVVLFDGTAGQRVSAVQAASQFSIRLYAPDGSRVLPPLYLTTDYFDVRTLPLTGTYTLAISTSDGVTTGSANFTLYNVQPDTIQPITGNGIEIDANLAIPGQGIEYTFNANAGTTVSLLESSSINSLLVNIIDPDGANKLYSSGRGFSDGLPLPQTGTYTIQLLPTIEAGIGGTQPVTSGETGAVATTLWNVPPDIGGPITVGSGPFTGTTTTPGQHMVYTFSGETGQQIGLVTQPDNVLSKLESGVFIIAPDGQTFVYRQEVDVAGFSGGLTLPQTGSYELLFKPGRDFVDGTTTPVAGSETFNLYNIPPVITGTIVAGGAPITVPLATPGQQAQYTFSGTAGEQIEVISQGDSSLGSGVSVGVSNAFLSQVFDTGSGFIQFWILQTGGTYTINVSQKGLLVGNATVQIEMAVTGMVTTDGASATFTTVNPGQPVFVNFNATAGQLLQLNVQMDTAFAPYNNGVSIFDPLNNFVAGANQTGSSLQTAPFTATRAGTYTIRLLPGGPADGDVLMQLTPISAVTTSIVAGGPPVTAAIVMPGQPVHLTFSGIAGQNLRLVTQQDPAFGAFRDSINVQIGSRFIYLNQLGINGNPANRNLDLSQILTLPETGTYTINYTPGGSVTGNVVMQLDFAISNTILAGGLPVVTNITDGDDALNLTFQGVQGQAVTLLTQPDPAFDGGFGYIIQINAPNPDIFPYFNEATTPDDSGVVILPQTGTYAIQFAPTVRATGDVIIQLLTASSGMLSVGGPSLTTSVTPAGNGTNITFSGTAGQKVELLTQPDPVFEAGCNGNGCGYTIEINGPTFNAFGPIGYYFNNSTLPFDDSGTITLPITGTYSVQFSPSVIANGKVSWTLVTPTNDTLGALDYTMAIATSGTVAQQTFSGIAGDRISLLTQADTNLRQGCFTISITDPDGQTQLYSNTQSSPTDFSQALTVPTTGTYSIALAACGNATGNAAVTLYTVPADAAGSTTIGGATTSVATVVPGQNVQISFPTAAANQTANIAITADANYSSACYNVTVTDPSGNVVNTGQSCGTTYSTGVLTLPTVGSYTIAVASASTAIGNVTVGVTAQ